MQLDACVLSHANIARTPTLVTALDGSNRYRAFIIRRRAISRVSTRSYVRLVVCIYRYVCMWTYRMAFHGRQLLSVVRSEVQHHTSSVHASCCSVASHRQVQRLALHTLPPRLQGSPLPQSLNRHTAHGNRNEHTAALPHTHRHSREGAFTGSTHRYLVVLLV